MAKVGNSKGNTWLLFIGVVLILIGLYASIRTLVNLTVYDKYPTEGVLSFNSNSYQQKESDCTYEQIYYTQDNKPRPGTEEEIARDKKQQTTCLNNVAQARQNAKTNDITQSVIFLALGAGVLFLRKFLS